MLFNVALFSSLLLSPVVLALPSGLGARIARRGQSSQGNNRPERDISTVYSPDFSGALWFERNGTFGSITGTFAVPTASGTNGSEADILVGIDGFDCSNTLLGAGVSIKVNDSVSYTAWYAWLPDRFETFPDLKISAGDTIKLTVDAWSSNSATLEIDNLTNGQVVSKSLNSSTSLCKKNAQWGMIDFEWTDGSLYPLADFGTITFTEATATGEKTWYPSGAQIFDMKQNDKVLTNVTVDGTSITIQYV